VIDIPRRRGAQIRIGMARGTAKKKTRATEDEHPGVDSKQ
jgi:hypothetical protein